ncbi:TonB-dependent receptor [Maribacter sp. 2-571]|uniref:TonB-dependent receptor n=1 Tax=Maribacter sp. 2-571 TaxID=3417569 RepID=UPI003D34D80A
MRSKNIFYILFWLLLPSIVSPLLAQSLSGTITDETGAPIFGANVLLLNATKGGNSDMDGNYAIENVREGLFYIQASYLGYQTITKQVNIEGDTVFDFVLEQATGQLQEVIITANRRSENIQKTAASVSAVTSKEIQQLQINEIGEMNSIAPNFRLYDDGATGAFTLAASRGISTIDSNPVIGLYIDDVPYFSTFAFPLQLADVDQIEVLRGPQGTLYGRNALAGVIKITSKRPTNDINGYATLGYGNLDAVDLDLAFNMPVVKDKLFFRANTNISEREGFVANSFNDKDLQDRKSVDANFRLKYYANDRLSMGLSYSLQRRESNAYAFVLPTPDNTLQDILGNSLYQVNFNEDVLRQALTQNTALTLKYNFDNFALTSVTAYQNTEQNRTDEFDYSPLDIQSVEGDLDLENLTQELRLGSIGDRKLDWTAGVFLFRNENVQNDDLNFGADLSLVFPDFAGIVPYNRFDRSISIRKGIAVFGQATYDLTEKLALTAGLRYDHETVDADVSRSFSIPVFPTDQFSETADFNAFSPKIAVSYQATENVFLFANAAKGFRPGGINTFVLDRTQAAFDPETTLNYEAGVKTNLFDNRLKLNLTGFFINYDNQQVFTILNLETFDFGTDNIGESRSYGIELESQWAATKSLSFGLNLGYLNTEVLDYRPLDFNTGQPIDLSGKELPVSPNFNGNFTASYIAPISKKINLETSLDYVYQSDSFFDVPNDLLQEAYELLNGRLGLTSKNLDFFVWGKNLTDEAYFSYGYGVGGFNAASFGLPQTYGAAITVKF